MDVKKLAELIGQIPKIVAFLKTDDETFSAGEDLEMIYTQALQALDELACQEPPESEFVKKCGKCKETKFVDDGGLLLAEMITGGHIKAHKPPRIFPCPKCCPELFDRVSQQYKERDDRLAAQQKRIKELEAEANFAYQFNLLAKEIYEWACEKGHWEAGKDRNNGEMITFMHSELSEAWEALRDGNPPDEHCPEFSGAVIEFADCIIRIMDTAYARKWKLAEAILAKKEFNKNRPYKHGRQI